MTYSESARGIIISVERAYRELDKHGIPFEDRPEFIADMRTMRGTKFDSDGNIASMKASDVLAWLGY